MYRHTGVCEQQGKLIEFNEVETRLLKKKKGGKKYSHSPLIRTPRYSQIFRQTFRLRRRRSFNADANQVDLYTAPSFVTSFPLLLPAKSASEKE